MALSSDAESPRGPGRLAADGLGGLAAALLEAVDDGLYVVDREWRFVYANPRACAMWGAARETVIGEVLWQRFPAIVGTRAGQLLRQAVENGEPYEFEVFSPVVKRWLWLRAHPLGNGLTGVHWRDVTERRQTEEALRASEERLRIASETARLGYWERDFATGELRASALCKANFGRSPDAPLSYDQVLAAIDPAHRERVQETTRRAMREGREYESEHPITWPDGSVHWISVRGRCLYAEDGTPLRDIGVTLDITARRRLEQDLRESEERYRLFAEAALEGVVVHDFERILDVSRRFAEMFGYRPEELIGQPVAVLESMVLPEEVAQARRRVATQHTGFNEMACLRRDGTPFTIEYAARHLTYRDRAVRLAIARDITERKRHEAALKRVNETLERQIEERARQLSASRARLRAFFDNSPDWLTLQRATADGRFVYVDLNPTCEAAYGLPRERVIGRRLEEVLGEEAAQVPLHHLREALRTGAPQRYVAHRTMAGRTRAIDVMFVLVPGAAEGDDRFIITTARDITEREELEARLGHAQKMEAVGQLTGGVAHDFNNLLTTVITSLDIIGASLEDERLRRLAEAALRSATRGARLTQQLLSFARRQTLHAAIIDLNALLLEMEPLLKRAVGEAIELSFSPSPGLWPCKIDVAQFEAAAMNLVVNARDAMPGGGGITLAAANVTVVATDERDLPAGGYVELTVADTGHGMAPEVLRRAFEPFYTTKEVGKGSGLGLSMVEGFVRQSGGSVQIRSTPGAGTVVQLYFPRAAASEAARAVEQSDAGLDRGSGTILLVEDDTDVREVIAGLLRETGYRLVAAGTAPAALRLLQQTSPVDLLLTDLVMPAGMSGLELAREARRQRPGIRVLLTSGYAASSLPAPGEEEGFAFIAKPYRPAELLATIRELLRGSP